MLDVRPGVVTGEDPFRVALAGDPAEGLPCERVGDVDDTGRGAVLTTPTGRLWLGPYGPQNALPALGDRVAAVERQTVAVARSANVTASRAASASTAVAAVQQAVERVETAQATADQAAQQLAQDVHDIENAQIDLGDGLNGVSAVMTGTAATPPTTRRNGTALQAGDLYYRLNTESPPQVIDIQVYEGPALGWRRHRIAAGSVLVPGSVGAVLIEDSAVTAPKINAGALDFKEATGMTLTAGTITGTDIIGATVTGGITRTSATNNRVQMDAFNGGQLYVMSGGVVRQRISVNNGLEFFSPTGVPQGYIAGAADRLSIWSNERISATAANITIGYSAAVNSNVQIDAKDYVQLTNGFDGRILMDNGGIYQRSLWQEFHCTSAAAGYDKWYMRPIDSGGTTRNVLQFSGGGAGMMQTTLAANLHIDVNGSIFRTSSAARFKRDIRDVGVDPYRLLEVPVRDWLDHAAADGDPRIPGVVAEEVEAAGLNEFVAYEADGQAAGVLYDRLPLLLIPILRDVIARLDRLENAS